MPDTRPDLASILPSVYDLTAWLATQEESPETPGHVRRALVTVNAHIANHYWADWNADEHAADALAPKGGSRG
jgi:hypothetical protein